MKKPWSGRPDALDLISLCCGAVAIAGVIGLTAVYWPDATLAEMPFVLIITIAVWLALSFGTVKVLERTTDWRASSLTTGAGEKRGVENEPGEEEAAP